MVKYEKIPEGLAEGYLGPRIEIGTPVSGTAASANEADNDANPLERESDKRSPGTPGFTPQRTKSQRLLSPKKLDLCCPKCTKGSTCSTKRCACLLAKRHCRNCNCFEKCFNRGGKDLHCVEIDDEEAEATDSIPTPRTLNYEETNEGEDDGRSNDDADETVPTPPSQSVTPGEEEDQEPSTTMPIGDLPGVTVTEADRKLMEVYDDYIHQNDGTHLDGGIKDDAMWQENWRKLVVLPPQRYDTPSGPVGRRFVRMLTEELKGIKSRKWNSEKFLVFQMVILQRSKEVSGAGNIKRRLTRRMDAWEKGKFDMLVQDTERTALAQLAKARGDSTPEQRAKTYARLVLQGKLRAAVRWITEREMGGILQPDERDAKTGDTVLEVLESKHPDAKIPDASDFQAYDSLPELVELDITEEVCCKVARRL
jgi:hypothetical protein